MYIKSDFFDTYMDTVYADCIELSEGELAYPEIENPQEWLLNAYQQIAEERGKIDAIKKEVARLNALIKYRQNVIDKLETKALCVFNTLGVKAVDCGTMIVKMTPSKFVAIDDDTILPDEFWRSPPPTVHPKQPDKNAIKAAINRGEYVPGAHVAERCTLKAQ